MVIVSTMNIVISWINDISYSQSGQCIKYCLWSYYVVFCLFYLWEGSIKTHFNQIFTQLQGHLENSVHSNSYHYSLLLGYCLKMSLTKYGLLSFIDVGTCVPSSFWYKLLRHRISRREKEKESQPAPLMRHHTWYRTSRYVVYFGYLSYYDTILIVTSPIHLPRTCVPKLVLIVVPDELSVVASTLPKSDSSSSKPKDRLLSYEDCN